MEEHVRALLMAGLAPVPVDCGLASGAALPRVVLSVVHEAPGYSHGGESTLHEYLLQVDCYGETYGAAKLLHRRVLALMAPPLAFLESARDLGTDETDAALRPWRVSADYRVLYDTTPTP